LASQGKKNSTFISEYNTSKETVNAWLSLLTTATLLFNAEHLMVTAQGEWKQLEADEAFWAARKFQRGHRVRASGAQTIMGGVAYDTGEDGKRTVIDCALMTVPNRKREFTNAFTLHVSTPDAEINTDQAGMYHDQATVRVNAEMVNHSIEFVRVTGDGRLVHTQSIEGHWQKIKGVLRALWERQTESDAELGERFQLASFLVGCRLAGLSKVAGLLQVTVWYTRLMVAFPDETKKLVTAAKELMVVPKGTLNITGPAEEVDFPEEEISPDEVIVRGYKVINEWEREKTRRFQEELAQEREKVRRLEATAASPKPAEAASEQEGYEAWQADDDSPLAEPEAAADADAGTRPTTGHRPRVSFDLSRGETFQLDRMGEPHKATAVVVTARPAMPPVDMRPCGDDEIENWTPTPPDVPVAMQRARNLHYPNPKPTVWRCEDCSHRNNVERSFCEMCGKDRHVSST